MHTPRICFELETEAIAVETACCAVISAVRIVPPDGGYDQVAHSAITTALSCAAALCNAKRTPREEADFRMWTKVCPAGQLQPCVMLQPVDFLDLRLRSRSFASSKLIEWRMLDASSLVWVSCVMPRLSSRLFVLRTM